MEISEPVTQVVIPVRQGRKATDLIFTSRAECRALIAAIAAAAGQLPDDGEPVTVLLPGAAPEPEPVLCWCGHVARVHNVVSNGGGRGFCAECQPGRCGRYETSRHSPAPAPEVPLLAAPWTQSDDNQWRARRPDRTTAVVERLDDGTFVPTVYESSSEFARGPVFDGLLAAAAWAARYEPQGCCPECGATDEHFDGCTLDGGPAFPPLAVVRPDGEVELMPACPHQHPGKHTRCVGLERHEPPYRDTDGDEWVPPAPSGAQQPEAAATPEERLLLAVYGVDPDSPANVRELRTHAAECTEDDHAGCLAHLAGQSASVTA